MSWEQEVKEIERRRHLAQQQGGKEGIAKQHARGRMTIRERIEVLLDEGSFQEHGRATASPVYDDSGELIPTTWHKRQTLSDTLISNLKHYAVDRLRSSI